MALRTATAVARFIWQTVSDMSSTLGRVAYSEWRIRPATTCATSSWQTTFKMKKSRVSRGIEHVAQSCTLAQKRSAITAAKVWQTMSDKSSASDRLADLSKSGSCICTATTNSRFSWQTCQTCFKNVRQSCVLEHLGSGCRIKTATANARSCWQTMHDKQVLEC